MKLYHWEYTTCNQAYSDGSIIVMANTVADARAKAKEFALHKVKDLYRSMEWLRNSKDEDDIEEFNKKMAEVDADLAEEPECLEGADAVIFITGGE